MKPFRKNVAIAIDGGGIKGVICTRALAMLEDALGKNIHDVFRLAVGTSTGSIISAGVGAGISAKDMYQYYVQLGEEVFVCFPNCQNCGPEQAVPLPLSYRRGSGRDWGCPG